MKKLLFTVLMIILLLSACSRLTPPEFPAESPPQASEEPEEPIVYTNPLTGVLIEKKPENTRPFAVMINNVSVALPHCGTSQADIIYELLAEGDITRMLAIYSDISDVEKIGSMRSARPYYLDLALSYDAIYVHAGGSEQAYTDIFTKNTNNLDGVRETYNADVFYRDHNRMTHGTEHSLFTSAEGILAGCEEKGFDLAHEVEDFDYGLVFAKADEEISMTDSVAAANVNVSFGGIKNTCFDYNSAKGHYSAEEYGKAMIDGNNNESLKFKNVLVLYAYTKILDDSGRRSVDLFGEGSGKFFCNGKSVDITWEHDNQDKCFRYFSSGKELVMGAGNTYIAIVPMESEIGIS